MEYDTIPLPGGDGAQDETPAALFRSQDLELVWSNRAYRHLLDEPYRSTGAEGLRHSAYSPVASAFANEAMLRCLQTGTAECGQYQVFSVEDGTQYRCWHVYRTMSDYLLVLVHSQRAGRAADD